MKNLPEIGCQNLARNVLIILIYIYYIYLIVIAIIQSVLNLNVKTLEACRG